MIANHDIAPAIMFHSVGSENDDWVYSYISEPVEFFEKKIELLKRNRYNFIFWEDLYRHMTGEKRCPPKSIMLTFDDGYLDNWVYAFPILQKFNAKATIFISPEFVDPSNDLRPKFDGFSEGNTTYKEIKHLGFLNWNEMQVMEQSGLVDIQSHSLSHTWYFSGKRLVDFVRPGEKNYPWLAWNSYPQKKPFYLIEDYSNLIPIGTPVYEHEKALICRRYIPSPDIAEKMVEYVRNIGEMAFESSNWFLDFKRKHNDLSKKYKSESRRESKEEYLNRVLSELKLSKKIIEEKLHKKVEFVSWPGGGYNKDVLHAAKLAGYKAWTFSSTDNKEFRNSFHVSPFAIKRIHSFSKYRVINNKTSGYANKYYFYSALQSHKGSIFFKFLFITLRCYGILIYIFKKFKTVKRDKINR